MSTIIGILLSAIAFVVGAKLMNSVEVKDFKSAILVAIVMALLNGTIGAVVNFLGTPINWLTLGLFGFIVSAILILIASKVLGGFHVRNFWSALVLAFIVSLVNWALHGLTGFQAF